VNINARQVANEDKMKNHKWKSLSATQLFTASIFFVQAVFLSTSQTIDNIEVELSENKALKRSTESPIGDGNCPHCSILSEVSVDVNQHKFQDNSVE
jgi:hypothetical protein